MISCTVALAERLPWPEPLRVLADAGFARVNLPANHFGVHRLAFDRDADRMRREFADFGLGVDWVHAPYGEHNFLADDNGERRVLSLGGYLHLLDQAARIGARAMVFHPYWGRLPDGMSADAAAPRLADAFGALADRAARLGVAPCLENMTDDATNVCTERILDATPNLQFCYDVGHAFLAGNAARWLPRYAGRVGATHVHDNDGPSDPRRGEDDRHRIPGDGRNDWPAVKRLLDAARLAVPLGLEVHPQADPEAAARRAYAAAQAVRRGVSPRGT